MRNFRHTIRLSIFKEIVYQRRWSEPFCYFIESSEISHVIIALLVVGKSKWLLVKILIASICISSDIVVLISSPVALLISYSQILITSE